MTPTYIEHGNVFQAALRCPDGSVRPIEMDPRYFDTAERATQAAQRYLNTAPMRERDTVRTIALIALAGNWMLYFGCVSSLPFRPIQILSLSAFAVAVTVLCGYAVVKSGDRCRQAHQ